jgi:BioD-like phosphotransacetylase family protein
MPALYIASPWSGEGKTAIAVGLARGWQGRGKKLGFLRLGPSLEGDVSFAQRLGLEAASCPPAEVEQAYGRLSQGTDLVMIEGLVPEVEAALKELRGKVLLVLPFAGVEKAGEAAGRMGEALVGAVLNMVPRSRIEKTKKELVPALRSKNVVVLGVLPEERALLAPSVADLAQYLEARVVLHQDRGEELVGEFMVGALALDPAPVYFGRKEAKAVITRRDRPDILLGALQTPTRCLVLTGGGDKIDPYVLRGADTQGVAVLVVEQDTPTTLERLEACLLGVRFRQENKLPVLQKLLQENLDLKVLEEGLGV